MNMNNEHAFPLFEINTPFNGMTLRDYFAGQAMQAIISASHQSEESRDKYTVNDGYVNLVQITKEAYRCADLMLEERKKE